MVWGCHLVDIAQQAEEIVEAAANEQSQFEYRGSTDPERVAWLVMLAAFALFCTFTLSTALGVYYYLFQSTAPLPVELQVAKGTVGITGADLIETVERESSDLSNTATSISTDSLSQATIQIYDIAEEETAPAPLLAAITLQGNTFLTFNHANRPRFEWSQNPLQLQFSRLRGELDIVVTEDSDHSFLMDIYTDALNTDRGVHIEFVAKGRYRLSVSEDEVRLHNLDGEAIWYFHDDPGYRKSIESGMEFVLRIGNRSSTSTDTTESILANAAFSLQSAATGPMYSPAEPANWNCTAQQDAPPEGSFALVDHDGRVGLRLRRLQNAISHGQVACVREFEGEGLDVSQYDSLRMVTTFSLNYQSLSLCGEDGSECPLMLRIDYENSSSRPTNSQWFRGFYYEDRASDDYKKLCASCFQDHLDTNQAVWYTFDSGNLLNLISETDRPQRINAITFYASGHQFDTVVSEMILLASRSSDRDS